MKFFSKRKVAVALAVLGIFFVSFIYSVSTEKNVADFKKITIVLDAGHGGIDGGSTGVTTGVKESELNLLIVKELETLFSQSGFKVILTRDGDYGLYGDESAGFKLRDLKKRVEIVNNSNAELLLSIHINKFSSPSRKGVQVFYRDNDNISKLLADSIQLEVNLLKEQERMFDALVGDYYVLNEILTSGVIVECGFLSNESDEKLLLSDAYRKKLAKRIYSGVFRYFSRQNTSK